MFQQIIEHMYYFAKYITYIHLFYVSNLKDSIYSVFKSLYDFIRYCN